MKASSAVSEMRSTAPGVKGVGCLVSILGMILGISSVSYIFVFKFLIVQDTRSLHSLSTLIFCQTSQIIFVVYINVWRNLKDEKLLFY